MATGVPVGSVQAGTAEGVSERRVASADGVEIAFTAAGKGDIALVFIHGGLADRCFWQPQMDRLAETFRVVALDLGGHGDSGRNRSQWRIATWAEDVRAVVEAQQLGKVVLVGNSLGGPVALEAARLLAGRVLGVVGVDTLQDLARPVDSDAQRARAKAFRTDFAGSCHALVDLLFHPGKEAELRAWAERRMCAIPPEIVVSMMEGFAGLDLAAMTRAAGVPIRAINGDLFPTEVEKNRTVAEDFAVAVMEGAGHYPMLERPAEFNRILVDTVRDLERAATAAK